MIMLISLSLLFFILSIFLFNGKGSSLIAGYNTLSKQEKTQFDKLVVCKAVGMVCLVCAIMLASLCYFAYLVEIGTLEKKSILLFSLFFILIILVSIIYANKLINKAHKK